MRGIKGQNLIEFLVILAVVAIASIFALTMLGFNINDLFSKSTEKQSNFDPFNVKNQVASAIPATPTTPTTPTYTVVSTDLVDGYPVNRNSDGSVTLTVGSQSVNIDANMLNLNDTVFQTTGASGDVLISTIAHMIEQNETEYPAGVPVNISYGQGVREATGYTTAATYEGSASINTVAVSVGKNVVIYQKDQTCTGSCAYSGVYRIEGTIGSGNAFNTTNVTADLVDGTHHTGTFNSSTTSTTTGAMTINGNFTFDTGSTYNWDIDFDDLLALQ